MSGDWWRPNRLRKLRWLVRAGAQITVIAPEVDPQIQRMRDAGELVIERKEFYAEAINPQLRLVISATNAPQVSESVFVAAMKQGVLVNCVDRTELCTIIFPAIIDRFPYLGCGIQHGPISNLVAQRAGLDRNTFCRCNLAGWLIWLDRCACR